MDIDEPWNCGFPVFVFFLTHPDQHFPQIHQLLVFWRDTFLDRFGLTKVRACTVNMDWRGKTSPWCTMAAFLQRCFIFWGFNWMIWMIRWPFTFDLQAAEPCFMIHRYSQTVLHWVCQPRKICEAPLPKRRVPKRRRRKPERPWDFLKTHRHLGLAWLVGNPFCRSDGAEIVDRRHIQVLCI